MEVSNCLVRCMWYNFINNTSINLTFLGSIQMFETCCDFDDIMTWFHPRCYPSPWIPDPKKSQHIWWISFPIMQVIEGKYILMLISIYLSYNIYIYIYIYIYINFLTLVYYVCHWLVCKIYIFICICWEKLIWCKLFSEIN